MDEIQVHQTPETTTPATEAKTEAPKVETKAEPKADRPVHTKKSSTPKKEVGVKEFYANLQKEKGISTSNVVHGTAEAEAENDSQDSSGEKEETPDSVGELSAEEKEAFKSSFKYKVKDKEFEFPEWARPLIKDKEMEKNFTDIFTKAEGLEGIKEGRTQAEQRAIQAEQERDGVRAYASEVLKHRDTKNWDKFYKHLKVNDEDIVRHALNIVQRNNLPPEQKALYDRSIEDADAREEAENQFSQMQSMLQETNAKAKSVDLQLALAKADHTRYAENYEAMNELPAGSFKQAVIDYGKTVYLTTGKDLSADEAITELKARLGKGYIPKDASQQTQTPKSVMPAVKKDLPVIPNVRGNNVSHVKKEVRSTKDLKTLYKEKFG